MESSNPHLSTDQNNDRANVRANERSDEKAKEKRTVPKEVHQNLVSAVELNQLEEVQRCLHLGANPEQRFFQTFGQHYLTERAILNQNDPMARLLLEGRSPEQEEILRIVRAAIRVNNYAWIEQYGGALSETNPTILEMTLEFGCMGIFNRIVQSFLHEPIQPLVQGWYQLAIKYRQPDSIAMIYGQTQIRVKFSTFKQIFTQKRINYKLIKACLDAGLDLQANPKFLINRPYLVLFILIHSEHLLVPWFVQACLEMNYTHTVGLSLIYGLIYGCPYPSYFEVATPGQGLVLFFDMLRQSGSFGLKYIWDKLSPRRLYKFEQQFKVQFDRALGKFNFRMVYLIGQTGFNLYPFLLSVDYLHDRDMVANSEHVRTTLIKCYSHLQSERSFGWPFDQATDLDQDLINESSSDETTSCCRPDRSRLIKPNRHEQAYRESRKRILRQLNDGLGCA